MKIQTMSIVVGGKDCNAHCPYCVSKANGFEHMVRTYDKVNWRNFHIACQLAEKSGVSTILLTGKGEPTLHPELILEYLDVLKNYPFPFKELQTNGIEIDNDNINEKMLNKWYDRGLTTICISIVHFQNFINKNIYQPNTEAYMRLDRLIAKIIKAKFMVRLSCILLGGYIEGAYSLGLLIDYCKIHGVKQLTIRPMTAPGNKKTKPQIGLKNII